MGRGYLPRHTQLPPSWTAAAHLAVKSCRRRPLIAAIIDRGRVRTPILFFSPFVGQSTSDQVTARGRHCNLQHLFRFTISCYNLRIFAIKSQNREVEIYAFQLQNFRGNDPKIQKPKFSCPYSGLLGYISGKSLVRFPYIPRRRRRYKPKYTKCLVNLRILVAKNLLGRTHPSGYALAILYRFLNFQGATPLCPEI